VQLEVYGMSKGSVIGGLNVDMKNLQLHPVSSVIRVQQQSNAETPAQDN